MKPLPRSDRRATAWRLAASACLTAGAAPVALSTAPEPPAADAAAATPPPIHPGRAWTIQFEPMLWAPALRGDLKVPGGPSFDVESLNLDEPNLAPAGEVTIRAEKWSFFFSGFGLSFDETATARESIIDAGPVTIGAGQRTRSELDFFSFQATAGYEVWSRFFDPPEFNPADEVRASLDLCAGARYFDANLDLAPVGGAAAASSDGQWVQPIAGARLCLDLPYRTGVEITGDVGGWGFGDDGDSSFAWNLTAAFFWAFHDNAGLEIGFRVLGGDLQDGEGANEFNFDAVLMGLFGSVIVRF